jgi:hypothetical protein
MISALDGPTSHLAVEEAPMRYRPNWLIWLSTIVGVFWASALPAWSQSSRPWQRPDKAPDGARLSVFSNTPIPLNEIPDTALVKVRTVLDHSSLSARGQPETFNGEPRLYQWFLDHPDRAAKAWKRLGAKVADVTDRGNGVFGWNDGQGSDIRWQTVYRGQRMRVWHAEGKVRPAALLPLVSVQAVVVLRYAESRDSDGSPVLLHQAELILRSDSKTMSLAARLFGTSAPRLAEQYVSQVEMFFSALSWYCEQHPETAKKLLAD